MLTEEDLDGLNMESAKYLCSPPPRGQECQKACWEGIETGVFDIFSSDHCPFRYEGVSKGRIDINKFLALTSTSHAKIYGLYPRKGTIAIGSDADIAISDPEREVMIVQDLMHGGSDCTPYEGLEVKGWPVTIIVRGKPVVLDGELLGKLG